MKNMKKSKPTQEVLNTYKEISNFINREKSEKERNINNIVSNSYGNKNKRKIKMPFKMYMGIKKSVLKKHEKDKVHNERNEIIGETHKKEKLMTNVILNKLEKQNESKKNKKLWISRNNKKSRFQNGVMKLSKNFMKNTNRNSNKN